MKKILTAMAAFCAATMGSAHAVVVLSNADFESPYALTNSDANGAYEFGAAGWTHSGLAGTYDPDDSSGNIYASSSDPRGRVGFLLGGSSLSQLTNEIISANTSYTISALFGHRNTTGSFAGSTFGFYAGNVNNIIGTANVVDPGTGLWGSQSYTLDAAFLANYVGQQLGIIFMGVGAQLNFDEVAVNWADDKVVPLPGAVWLFGTALLGGGLIRRKRKKTA